MNAFAKAIVSFSLAASLATAGSAQSSIAVRTGDLDLTSVQGKKALSIRIARAARAVCASEALNQSPDMIRAERRCVEETRSDVEQQIAARAGYRTAAD